MRLPGGALAPGTLSLLNFLARPRSAPALPDDLWVCRDEHAPGSRATSSTPTGADMRATVALARVGRQRGRRLAVARRKMNDESVPERHGRPRASPGGICRRLVTFDVAVRLLFGRSVHVRPCMLGRCPGRRAA